MTNNEGPDLLIVPYGIETLKTRLASSVPSLLIVPYGIETKMQVHNINPDILF